MKNIGQHLTASLRFAFAAALVLAAASWTSVSAQNPGAVFVEGNCDSPVFGTTLVSPGTCGDFDGDGRIGTAEDTDGADFIYGTIQSALEAIDHNGKVVIVKSGRFHENVYIGQGTGGFPFGAAVPGNVTLEAAPGVEAVIDAFAQGGPAADNNTRSASAGITVNYTTNGAQRLATIRNVQVRNFAIGIAADNNARVNIENARIENNVFYGIRLSNNVRGTVSHTHVTGTGFRVSGAPAPNAAVIAPSQGVFLGSGIFVNQNAQGHISNTVSSHNSTYGISANTATGTPVVVVTQVSAPFNNTAPTLGPVTQCSNVALCP